MKWESFMFPIWHFLGPSDLSVKIVLWFIPGLVESKYNYLKKSAGCGYFCTVWYTSHLDCLFFAHSGTISLPVEIMIWRSLEKNDLWD